MNETAFNQITGKLKNIPDSFVDEIINYLDSLKLDDKEHPQNSPPTDDASEPGEMNSIFNYQMIMRRRYRR